RHQRAVDRRRKHRLPGEIELRPGHRLRRRGTRLGRQHLGRAVIAHVWIWDFIDMPVTARDEVRALGYRGHRLECAIGEGFGSAGYNLSAGVNDVLAGAKVTAT